MGYPEYAKYYDGVEELKEDSEIIVLGKVIDVESLPESGLNFIKRDIKE